MTTILLRAAALALLVAVTLVTVLPIAFRPVSSMPVGIERIGAYAALGLCWGAAYPRHRWWVLAGLVAVCGLLEAAQNLVATRHGRIGDFAVKATGTTLGLAAAAFASRFVRRRSPR